MPRRSSLIAKLRASIIGAITGSLAAIIVLGVSPHRTVAQATVAGEVQAGTASRAAPIFGFCHRGGGSNCVVDGDTVWIDSEKIRVADIDAPETHPPRCADEAAKGAAATQRLQALLNAGPFELVVNGRDRDRYGRALRIIMRDGRSLGDQLVAEGLARRWTGRREPWC
jgi:micrococcal nuclease